jgi:alkaline phosphatase D
MIHGVLAAYAYSRTGLPVLKNWLGPNAANPGLRYVDTTANGYGLATVDKGEMRVQLVTMEDVRGDFVEAPAIRHVAHFSVPLWRAGDAPQLAGPEFTGGAPFPFESAGT